MRPNWLGEGGSSQGTRPPEESASGGLAGGGISSGRFPSGRFASQGPKGARGFACRTLATRNRYFISLGFELLHMLV